MNKLSSGSIVMIAAVALTASVLIAIGLSPNDKGMADSVPFKHALAVSPTATPSPEPTPVADKYFFVGNRAFIKLHVEGESGKNPQLILQELDEFEKKFPNLKIANWKISEQGYDGYGEAYHVKSRMIYGIWIDHIPKPFLETTTRQLK